MFSLFSTLSNYTYADEAEEKKAYVLIGIPIGASFGLNSVDPVTGVSFISKNGELTENRIGDWEAGGIWLFTLRQNTPQNLSIYLGHGISFQNRLSAGLLAGLSFIRNQQNTDTLIGSHVGLRAGWEIPIIGRISIIPNAQGFITSFSSIFTFVSVIELSYRIDLPKPWNK